MASQQGVAHRISTTARPPRSVHLPLIGECHLLRNLASPSPTVRTGTSCQVTRGTDAPNERHDPFLGTEKNCEPLDFPSFSLFFQFSASAIGENSALDNPRKGSHQSGLKCHAGLRFRRIFDMSCQTPQAIPAHAWMCHTPIPNLLPLLYQYPTISKAEFITPSDPDSGSDINWYGSSLVAKT